MMAFNPNTGIQFESGSGWAGYFSKRHAIKLLRPGGLRMRTLLPCGFNRVTTVGKPGDSVMLRPAQPGADILVFNDGGDS